MMLSQAANGRGLDLKLAGGRFDPIEVGRGGADVLSRFRGRSGFRG